MYVDACGNALNIGDPFSYGLSMLTERKCTVTRVITRMVTG